jgi:hypothetical protein
VTLLATVCTGESFELAQMFGDDVAFRSGMYHVGPSQLAQMFYLLGQAGSGRRTAARARAAAGIALAGGKTVEASFLAHCAVTRQVSRRLGLPPGVGEVLSHPFRGVGGPSLLVRRLPPQRRGVLVGGMLTKRAREGQEPPNTRAPIVSAAASCMLGMAWL